MILDTLIGKGYNYINKFSNIYIRHLIKQSLSKYLEDKNDIIIKSKNIGDFIYIHINRIKFNNNILDGVGTPLKLDSFIADNIIIKIKWKETYETTILINTIKIFYNLQKVNFPDNILYSLYDNLYKSISLSVSNYLPNSILSTDLKNDKDLLDLEDDINYLINCSKIKIKNFEIIDTTSNLKFITETVIHQRIKKKSGEYLSVLSLKNNKIIDYKNMLNIVDIPICNIFIKDNYDYSIKIDKIFMNFSVKNSLCWFFEIYKNYIGNNNNDSEDYCKLISIKTFNIKYYLKKIKHNWIVKNINYNNYILKINKINIFNSISRKDIFKNECIGIINLINLQISAEGYKFKLKKFFLNINNTHIFYLKEIYNDLLNLNNIFEKKENINIDSDHLIYSRFEDNEIIKKSIYNCKYFKLSIKDGEYKDSDEMIFNFDNITYINIFLSNRLIKNKLYFDNITILDKIKESLWNKFLYKDSNLPLLKFKWITSKDIKNTILLLKISSSPLIFNIDEHCIIFLLTIFENIKLTYFKNNLDKDNVNDLYIKETLIEEILITFSYKPMNKDIAGFMYEYSKFLSLTKIRDVTIYLNKIILDKNITKNQIMDEILNIWLNDLKENQYYKLLLFVDILKYFFYISCDIAENINDFKKTNDSLLSKFTNILSNLTLSISSNLLNLSTRSCIVSINLLEKLNRKDLNNKLSIYFNSPNNLTDSFEKSKKEIVERYNILTNNEYNLSYRFIQPLLGINKSIFNVLMGLHHSINPKDYYKKKERYNRFDN